MLKFLPLVMRNALRNRARTVLTVAIVTLGMTMLFSFLAVERSIDRTMGEKGSVGRLVVQEQFRGWPCTSLLFDSMAREIEEKVPHVVRTMPMVIAISAWRASVTKSFRLDGVDKDRILEFWNLAVPRAQLESFLATENGVLLGRRVFDTYGDKWSVGTAIQLGVLNDVAAVVCGVYDAGGSALDSRALAGREFVQKALGKQGICNSILVKVDGLNRVEEVIERIDRGLVLPKKTETVSESAVNARLLRELGDTRTAAALIACVALGAVFLGIWNALSMTVYDRVREFGVLRSIGFTRRRIAALVLMEGAGIALAGGALAVPLLLGAVALFGRVVGEIQLRDAVVPVSVDAALLGLSLPIAAAVGLLGSVIPAVAASTKSVVAALRSAG